MSEIKKVDLSKNVEAILFSAGDRVSIDELSKLTKEDDLQLIKDTLKALKEKYEQMQSPMVLHEEGNFWKMNVKEEHATTVRKLVKKMELPKTLLETLAVIAWKAPVKQSIVIAVRTNKAYDHLDELESKGYITRKKSGRTKLITLTEKFYDYFEINKKGGLDKVFKRVTERAKKKYGDMVEKIEEEVEQLESKKGDLEKIEAEQSNKKEPQEPADISEEITSDDVNEENID
jgi:segregation and condensation protein B